MNDVSFGPVKRFRASGLNSVPGEGHEPEQTPFLRYYGLLFWRWRRVLIGIIVGFMLLGLVVTLLMTPQYTATATIEISRDSAKIVSMQGVEQGASDADMEFYQTQYGLLRAQSLAERVADRLKLADDPGFFELFGADKDGKLFSNAGGKAVPVAGRDARLRAAGAVLLKHLRISPTRQSRLVDISFTSPSAALSQRVANAWGQNFIQANLERRFDASSYARTFLENRLGTLRVKLNESERELQSYAQAQRIITLPGAGKDGSEQSTIAFDLVSLNSALTQATAERIGAQARLAALAGRSSEATEALTNNALNQLRAKRAELAAEYQRLLTQFQPEYPQAQAQARQLRQLDASIAREEARVGGSVQATYRAAAEREKGLQEKVSALEGQFLDQRRRSIQYRVLQREVDTNRQLYDALLQRYKEIGIAGGVGTNNVAIVDLAGLPFRPSSPRLLLNLLLALLAGLAIGTVVAFLLDQSDESLADPGEAERLIGVPLLGSVPRVEGIEPSEALLDRKSVLVDAYLAVQTSLQFSTEDGVPASLAVTSTRPGEGKSTTALALATLLARSGRKVVLVDGDMRSPSVHHLIGTGHERGLSNYLSGNATAAELLISVPKFGFSAITAGPIPPNAAELLTGTRLAKLIEELRKSFDHVVIDAPPVMGLADVPLIAGNVDGVIYAIESHGIRLTLVRTALQRLSGSASRILGAVVTKFEPKRANKGYGYTYGYDYGQEPQRGRSKR
ncbi:GumC family protein [Sphingomonas sp. M1-B02]|uniref:GumC family protein n=1 Tax=Sphingomonas sp. M1-B02 TaxID=3114300 RepID=UPI0022404388|nr:polysaccharide biosynthesis tyrosine autokinase [Sphingomonas sp. S6-11]UZK65047.1 polysaccharide biosynthesis tyrosine autokinase [Sphingomonas sp. S6-11]